MTAFSFIIKTQEEVAVCCVPIYIDASSTRASWIKYRCRRQQVHRLHNAGCSPCAIHQQMKQFRMPHKASMATGLCILLIKK